MKKDKIVLLGKDKLNTIEVLIFSGFNRLIYSHNEFVLVNNVLREYIEIKKELKNPENSVLYTM